MKLLALATFLAALVPATASAGHDGCTPAPMVVDAGGAAFVYVYDQPECTGAIVEAGDALCGPTSFHFETMLGAATASAFAAPGGASHPCSAGALLVA